MDEARSDEVSDNLETRGTSLVSVTNLVKRYISIIENAKKEQSTLKEMTDDALSNNKEYKEQMAKVKEAIKIRTRIKQKVLSEPALIEAVSKLKDFASEIKEARALLSEYLVEYQKLSGSNQLEDSNGEMREIVYVAKLVKPNSRSSRH